MDGRLSFTSPPAKRTCNCNCGDRSRRPTQRLAGSPSTQLTPPHSSCPAAATNGRPLPVHINLPAASAYENEIRVTDSRPHSAVQCMRKAAFDPADTSFILYINIMYTGYPHRYGTRERLQHRVSMLLAVGRHARHGNGWHAGFGSRRQPTQVDADADPCGKPSRRRELCRGWDLRDRALYDWMRGREGGGIVARVVMMLRGRLMPVGMDPNIYRRDGKYISRLRGLAFLALDCLAWDCSVSSSVSPSTSS
ncbi:hypothetical protein EDC01DRAFT_375973 [Geopyxis carbonaria]|nr:hypothetical protein EDC01DRAFT_375973 [Geopyxis carbonaria]